MVKKHLGFLTLALAMLVNIAIGKEKEDLVQLVNPLMGTMSDFSLSNGNTYPAIATPWGMNFWTPQTSENGNGWTYSYSAKTIQGLKQTHQPSPWINDYGAFSLMPVSGEEVYSQKDRASWFSHKAEIAKPNYYKVYLADHDVTAELTPTERCAQFRFTYPEDQSNYLVIDAYHKGSYVKYIPEENKIIGYAKNNSGGVPDNFKNYFVIYLGSDVEEVKMWDVEKGLKETHELEGENVGALVKFKTPGQKVNVKVGSSFISYEQAEISIKRELANDTFEQTKEKASMAWNNELNRIKIQGGTLQQQETFYSTLYRVLLFPRKFYEYNENDEIIHYSPYNGEVLPGYMFTDNGFWDTFRAVFPFFTVMYQELDAQIMEGLVNTYKESGWLPEWASPGHRDCMIGSNSASLITDAYIKGIRGYDIETLYEAMVKNTTGHGPEKSVGRYGAEYYNKLGYVPYDVDIHENAARTLEYAYADYCIYALGEELGKPKKTQKLFAQRSQNYKNLYDPETKWMRGKNEDGTFQSPFNPLKWGDAFTEGNSMHYTWSVFHDVEGLINLMGGEDEFTGKMDEVFNMPPKYDCSYYGFPIHEIREMQIADMGNYAHGNQPIQHMIYLYNYAGQPWKAQQRVREVMDKLYFATPDGYCGDEDNGQTSAWYVFSAMGFYPVAPGTTQYVFGSPLFEKVELTLENGNTFEIEAQGNSKENIYVDQIRLNGQVYDKNFIEHDDIMNGGKLQFKMIDTPNKERGTSEESKPFSFSTK
ncbi:GH92 family glycosyl hydrolase [Aureibacter tunicatorum]|uniref:Alpha-1,2-mannosidase n=1 Tax=Aureibacter tunicatorum TaxID=866807 RepID=A0AAE4BTB3_9BACT|nr:GH92 family glycosyl hydrolase [Aureibacter tunicatorum]MDR6239382.1 putative alpha-1,2-mannosidase [Aureibacter tunicatorum]BDD04695.1 alpha-1 2-mannosidase [Aureibacter tunicatorum]